MSDNTSVSLTPEEILSISSMFSSDQLAMAKRLAEPGKYNVNITVGITGTINIGKSYEKAASIRPSIKNVLAFILKDLKVNKDDIESIIVSAVRSAIDEDPDADTLQSVTIAYDKVAGDLSSSLEKAKVSGRVTTNLSLSIIDDDRLK